MNLKNSKVYVLVGIGSGLASNYTLSIFADSGLYFGQGAIFGLIFSIFVYFTFTKSKKINIGLIIFPFITH